MKLTREQKKVFYGLVRESGLDTISLIPLIVSLSEFPSMGEGSGFRDLVDYALDESWPKEERIKCLYDLQEIINSKFLSLIKGILENV